MTSGRTTWQAQDSAWWRRERIVLAGERFGSEGPAIANWLECEAKAQNNGGNFKAGYSTAARGAFVAGGAERAQEIVNFLVDIGFLEDFEQGALTFKATIAAYKSDQGTGRDSLTRAARRAESDDPGPSGDDPPRPGLSGPVRVGPVAVSETGQERREDTPHTPAGGKKGVTFDRKPVPPPRLELAERILTEFNRQAGTNYGALTGRGKPSEDLKRIIGALTDAVPALEFDEARLMIEAALRNPKPYWDRPHTGIVFGPKVVATLREQARRAAPREEGAWSRGFVAAINSGGQAA